MSAFRSVGIVNPGEMGSAVGFAAAAGAARVVWSSAGRSAATRARAESAGLIEVGSLAELVRECDAIVSVCPPHAARGVAREIASLGFAGLYVDVNAISPRTAREVGVIVEASGATFVDGGIVGGPPRRAGAAVLYLSGPFATRAAEIWSGGPLEVRVLEAPAGAASAAKVCFAAWSKGSSALLIAIRALAKHEGVEDTLLWQWDRGPGESLRERSERAVSGSAYRAWRWVGEMEEIASAFDAAGLPAGFHEAAAEVYRALVEYKDAKTPPTVDEASAALLGTRSDLDRDGHPLVEKRKSAQ